MIGYAGHDIKLLCMVSPFKSIVPLFLHANNDFCKLIRDFRFLEIEHVMYMDR